MAKVGKNNEPLQETCLYAYDGTDFIRVIIDTDNVPINKPSYDGSDYQHLMVDDDRLLEIVRRRFGYKAVLSEISEEATALIQYTKTTPYVPSGEVWCITYSNIANLNRNGTYAYIFIEDNAGSLGLLALETAPLQYVGASFNGLIYLKENQRIRWYYNTCVVGDIIRVYYSGYKMEIST